MSNNSGLLWHDPAWQAQVREWIRTEAERQSIRLTGEFEQNHAYAWSTVMRVPSNQGTLFFKATAAETIYESALTQKLAGWYPDCMPELLAVDARRGWMLMRDGGEQLRASIRPMQNIQPWVPVVARYAEIQIGLAEHVDEILALGIPDHRLAVLPVLYSQLLTAEDSLMVGQDKGLTPGEVERIRLFRPRFDEMCTELAAFGLPETLNNGDFHDGNVLVKDGRITFFDWGDATVTHPFVSLRTLFVSIEISLQLDDDTFTPEMSALLDLYLEPWLRFASKDQLLKAYQLSKPVASIVKTLLWHQTISRLSGSLREEYAWIVPELWREFLRHVTILPD